MGEAEAIEQEDQRARLRALELAVSAGRPDESPGSVVDRAKAFADFILGD